MNILLADDNEDTLAFLENALDEEGFRVDTARNGADASAKVSSGDYDALVLDNVMPGKTGLEVCKEARRRGKNARIILLSVNGESDIKAQAMEAGADDYLSKPFSFEELRARLRSLLRRPEELQEEILEAGGFSLNTRNRSAVYKGKRIFLSPKEFDLLEYLLRNRGKVLSRMEILSHVWDMNADPLTNTVETHISNLRKKPRKGGAKGIVSTVPRAGYRIF